MDSLRFFLGVVKAGRGQDLAEYAIMLGLIALVVIAAVFVLGENMSTVFFTLISQWEAVF